MADIKRIAQEVPLFGREKRKGSAQKGSHRIAKPAQDGARIQFVATMCVDAIAPASSKHCREVVIPRSLAITLGDATSTRRTHRR